jgi:hypothetical protein
MTNATYNKAKDMGEIDFKEIKLFKGYNFFLKDAVRFDSYLWRIAETHVEHDGLNTHNRRSYVGRLTHELVCRYDGGISDDGIYAATQKVASEFF